MPSRTPATILVVDDHPGPSRVLVDAFRDASHGDHILC